jgi:hypothetical protein
LAYINQFPGLALAGPGGKEEIMKEDQQQKQAIEMDPEAAETLRKIEKYYQEHKPAREHKWAEFAVFVVLLGICFFMYWLFDRRP